MKGDGDRGGAVVEVGFAARQIPKNEKFLLEIARRDGTA